MQEITAALGSLRALIDLAKVAVDARDDSKVKQALADMNMKLFDVTSAALSSVEKAASLQASLMEAQEDLRRLKAATAEREDYALAEIRPGAFAYARKQSGESQSHEPPYYCQACYDAGSKAVLSRKPERVAVNARWVCPLDDLHELEIPGTARPYGLG